MTVSLAVGSEASMYRQQVGSALELETDGRTDFRGLPTIPGTGNSRPIGGSLGAMPGNLTGLVIPLAARRARLRTGLLFLATIAFLVPSASGAGDPVPGETFTQESSPSQAAAEEGVKRYSGGLGTRSALTGDWGGARKDMAEKGVTYDISLTQIVQGITDGGKDTGWEYGGRADIVIGADTRKLGLWPGGLFTVEVEGNFGRAVDSRTGAMMSMNANQNFPVSGTDGVAVPEVMLTQFFSSRVGMVIGKLDTGTDANEFAAGKGDTQFFINALTYNPAAFLTIPYSALGAGVIIRPTGDPKAMLLKLFAIDSNGKASATGFDTAFEGNTSYVAEGRARTDFLGMTGHQLIGASYSTNSFTSLDQDLRLFLEDRSIQRENRSWCVYYNFDQYLYETEQGSGRGIGIFGRFGASDGNPNTVRYFFSLGFGGKDIIPGRSLDSFGIGYYYIVVGHPTFTGPFAARSFLRDEQGFEAYYNIGIAPWMKLAPDIQVVRPAQKQTISGGVVNNVHTATVLGLRLQLIF